VVVVVVMMMMVVRVGFFMRLDDCQMLLEEFVMLGFHSFVVAFHFLVVFQDLFAGNRAGTVAFFKRFVAFDKLRVASGRFFIPRQYDGVRGVERIVNGFIGMGVSGVRGVFGLKRIVRKLNQRRQSFERIVFGFHLLMFAR
jgi:hypothetical protein